MLHVAYIPWTYHQDAVAEIWSRRQVLFHPDACEAVTLAHDVTCLLFGACAAETVEIQRPSVLNLEALEAVALFQA